MEAWVEGGERVRLPAEGFWVQIPPNCPGVKVRRGKDPAQRPYNITEVQPEPEYRPIPSI